MVSTQWRIGSFGAVGLDYVAVFQVAKALEIEMHPANLVRIQALERAELKRVRQAQEERNEPEQSDPS